MDTLQEKARSCRQPTVDLLIQKVVQRIEDYAGQAMAGVPEEVVAGLVERIVREVQVFSAVQEGHLSQLVKIGLGLSSEKNIDRLLERIVREARRFTNAEGGTLYTKESERAALDFAIVQNDSLGVFMGGSGEAISWPSVPLRLADNQENHRNVSAHCALTGEPVNILDVYDAAGFDFQGTRDFDASTGYRSCSMLVIPLRDHEDEVVGVLQLLNAKDRETGEVVAFPEHEVGMVMSLASQAAIALTKIRLVRGLENLLDAFVRTIGDTIDEKSPYTAGHVFRVANLTEQIALEVNRADTGKFAQVSFDADELAEIRMAAWLHDVGKITTPEHLLDKATKLEAIFDRIELVRYRVEIFSLNNEVARLTRQACLSKQECPSPAWPDKKTEEWQEIINFLCMINLGGEGLSAESIEKMRRLAGITSIMSGLALPLLTPDEVENLCIPKGTLTAAERKVINHHVKMSIRMLEGLPFPKKFRNVPVYAGMHHERLNGTGYPRGLKDDAIPLPAKILALADVLEALTAADRPYKPGKMLSEAVAILEGMADRGDLDENLCNLVVASGLMARFAHDLPERQRDDFFWRGRRYLVSETR